MVFLNILGHVGRGGFNQKHKNDALKNPGNVEIVR